MSSAFRATKKFLITPSASGYQTLTSTVDTMGTLLLRPISNRSGQTNQGRLVLLTLGLNDRVVDTLEVSASKLDGGHPVSTA